MNLPKDLWVNQFRRPAASLHVSPTSTQARCTSATTAGKVLTPRQRRLEEQQRRWREQEEKKKQGVTPDGKSTEVSKKAAQKAAGKPKHAPMHASGTRKAQHQQASRSSRKELLSSRRSDGSNISASSVITALAASTQLEGEGSEVRGLPVHGKQPEQASQQKQQQLSATSKASSDFATASTDEATPSAKSTGDSPMQATNVQLPSTSSQHLPHNNNPPATSQSKPGATSSSPADVGQQRPVSVAAGSTASAECNTTADMPFRVLPNAMRDLQLQDFLDEIELRQDTIYLDNNSRAVPESRLTGWQSDIGATFCYSGKEMQPAGPTMTPEVAKVRDQLTALTGQHFDSVLINYYPNGRCGMRFHVDPLYGCWTPNTAVVSIGETRRFVFREIRDFSSRWEYTVQNGDVVFMFGDCQDRLQHSIKVEREDRGAAEMGPRMSLVYKQRLRDDETGQYIGIS